MKKLFFIAAIASVAFASCVKNDPAPSVTEQQAITFAAPVVGLNTKGTDEVWNNYPTGAGYDFAVWAKYYVNPADLTTGTYSTWAEGKDYMVEIPVSYNANTWAPAANYYWPKNGSLTFIAYAPASKASYAEVGATGIKFNNYSVSTTVSEQVDLLFSERAYNKEAVDDDVVGSGTTGDQATTTDDPYKGVHLSFKHALSSIAFTVKTAADYSASTTITLNKIELVDVGSIASFDQQLADANNAPTTAAEWTAASGLVTYKVDNSDDLGYIVDTEAYWTSVKSKTGPAAAGGLRATDFILLPQNLSGAKLKVTYTLKNNGAGSEALVQVIEKDLQTAVVDTWKMGTRYIYNIILGLDTIYFEPYVAPWVDASAGQDFNF